MDEALEAAYRRSPPSSGVLFQIVDDILDVTGTDAALGKPQGSDERHGKRTYVTAVRARRGAPAGGGVHMPRRAPRCATPRRTGRDELEQITDFIPTRTPHDPRRSSTASTAPRTSTGSTRTSSQQVAQEVREHIIDTVGEIGGHFGANLGTCELAVALHSLLDSPRDKILWDVGHQAYPHKVLTGRRDQLPTIRQYEGLARSARSHESEHDIMGAGHASTSIGYAVGLKEAMRLRGDARRGQGRRGHRRRRDDRRRRLRGDPPGRRPRHADRRRAQRQRHVDRAERRRAVALLQPRAARPRAVARARGRRGAALPSCPAASAPRSSASARSSRSRSRRSGRPGLFWEELDWAYMGVVDGHDVRALRRALRDALDADRPVVVHIATVKGKGFAPAEDGGLEGMEKWHAAKPKSIANGVPARRRPAPPRPAAAVHAGLRRGDGRRGAPRPPRRRHHGGDELRHRA